MGNKFASGKNAIAECDICGFRYKLSQLKPLTIKTKITNILACPECWDPDHPQLQLGMYPVEDPQAIRNPRPDQAGYYEVGNQGATGSRDIQYGWNPVGGSRYLFDTEQPATGIGTPNKLIAQGLLNSVTVTVS
jgi:hypothetical protein